MSDSEFHDYIESDDSDARIIVTRKLTKVIVSSQGPQGIPGPRGFDTGTSGTSGTAGTSGIDGSSGTAGTSATSGTSGKDGSSGSSGLRGFSGTSGKSGTSGTSGTAGTSAEYASVAISETAPITDTSGKLWFNSNEGTLYVQYQDINGIHWIPTNDLVGADGTSGTSGTFSGDTGSFATTGSNTFIGNQTISGSVNIHSSIPPSLSIGDSFQGGKVAYILQSEDGGYDSNLIQGIIAAESDEPTTLSWFDAYTACDNKTTNGYTDWYLPNWATLYYTLYVNRAAIGGFTSNVYWSQTQVDFMNYQGYGFGDNSLYSSPNTYTYYVRAVRNFSIPKTALTVIGDSYFSGSLTVSSTYVNNSNVNLDQSNLIIDGGDLIVSGTSYFSGSLIPNTAGGAYTSSFSLGSNTNAWKDLWISQGSIIFVNATTHQTSSFTVIEDEAVLYSNGVSASYFEGDGSRLFNLPSTLYWNENKRRIVRPEEEFTFNQNYIIEDSIFEIQTSDTEYNYGATPGLISFKKIGKIFIGDKMLVKDSSIINDGTLTVGKSIILDGNSQIIGTGKII